MELVNSDSIKYLGVTLANKPSVHVNDRIAACRKAYYAMQGAGFCNVTTNANMLAYLWESAVRPVLLYGCSSVHVNKESMLKRENIQAKLLKTSIGVHKFCKSSPILQALDICKIESIIDRNSLELTRSMLSSSSRAGPFYIHLIKQQASGKMFGHRDLISRVKLTCKKYGISLLKYIFDDSYSRVIRN